MTCHREQRGQDVWFFCGLESGPSETQPRCEVCGGRRATLLCDGPREDDPGKTCDAPIHRRCSVRVAACSRWEAMELFANRAIKRHNKGLLEKNRTPPLKSEPDTIDFCPRCAARFREREEFRQKRGDGPAFVRLVTHKPAARKP